jgi:CRISPR system Cascade subunit CasD
MTGPVLTFRLCGPMAAFGDPATDERRGTELRPTRSGALGLIAAAMGIAREDRVGHEALSTGLGFATRVFADRGPMRDWHTIQSPKGKSVRAATRRDELEGYDLNTKLSQRWYIQSVDADVFVWRRSDAAPALEDIAAKLRRPAYVLYLGRKSCPLAAPLEPAIFADLASALARVPQGAPGRRGDVVPPLFSDLLGQVPSGFSEKSRSTRSDAFLRAGASWGHAQRMEIEYGREAPP